MLLPAVEAAIAEHGKVRLVYFLGHDFDDYEGEAVWEDLKLGVRRPTSFERVAVVSDARWAGAGAQGVQRADSRPGPRVPPRRPRGREDLGRRGRLLLTDPDSVSTEKNGAGPRAAVIDAGPNHRGTAARYAS